MPRASLKVVAGIAILGAAAFLLGGSSAAEESQPSNGAQAPALEVPHPLLNGMVVSIDPVTGRMRAPTPAERQQLAAAFKKQYGEPQPVRVLAHRDGMLSAVLGVDHLDFEVATLRPDGTAELSCVDEPEQAVDLLLNGSTEEEK